MVLTKGAESLRQSAVNLVNTAIEKNKVRMKDRKLQRKISGDAELARLKAKKELYEDILKNPRRIVNVTGTFFGSRIQSLLKYGPNVMNYTMEASMIGFNNIRTMPRDEVKKVIKQTEAEINERMNQIKESVKN